ncbi:MAG: cyclic pyranopterin phosphate synthase [Nitrosomonas sp.]|nr:MAG: cyclic pyranopterin phosphate synthase [Nitrosomonas sp.]
MSRLDYRMVDKQGRRMRKLRISLLDACNLRCLYCMPERPTFMPQKDWASTKDLIRITRNLVTLGIEEVRLTGGEPLLRRDFMEIAHELSALPVKKLGLTTNALLLAPHLQLLLHSKLQHLNISLDSLDAENFCRITRRDGFNTVMDAIYTAKEFGFSVKVNAVMMKGVNDHELSAFVKWSATHDIPVRFLEVMNIGVMKSQFRERFLSASDMMAMLRADYQFNALNDTPDSTSRNFHVSNGAKIGFITSESNPFCTGCSRLRLTPKGQIRPCLFMEEGIDLKSLASADYPAALAAIIAMKPTGRIPHQPQPMYQIGG